MSSRTSSPDGGPAFPQGAVTDDLGNTHPMFGGMSLRDYFAGQALPAIIAAVSCGIHTPRLRDGETDVRFPIARGAYEMADAMIAARETSS